MRIIRFFLSRPVGTLMICTGLSIGGIWSAAVIGSDFLPEIEIPRLTVVAPCDSLPAEDIRKHGNKTS